MWGRTYPTRNRLRDADLRLLAVAALWSSILSITMAFADERRTEFEHAGRRYDATGTLIGPLDLSAEEKVARLKSMIGTRGTITRTNGAAVREAVLLSLASDSFGNLDSLVFRSGPWEQKVPIDEISEVNAGGNVVVFGSHPRRMMKLREVNRTRLEWQFAERENELNAIEARLAQEREGLTALGIELESERRRHESESRRLREIDEKLSEREKKTERDVAELGVASRRWEEERSAWVKESDREKATRREWVERRLREEEELRRHTDDLRKHEAELTEREMRMARRERALIGVVKLLSGEVVPRAVIRLHGRDAGVGRIAESTTNASGVFVMEAISLEEFRSKPTQYRFEVVGHEFRLLADVSGQLNLTVHKP